MKRTLWIYVLMLVINVAYAQNDSTKLSGNVGIGIGTIRDQLSPHLDIIGLLNFWEQSELFQFGVWLKTTYSYADNEKSINTFLSTMILLSKHETTKGFGFGYAVKRQGSVFDKNTFLISYHYKVIESGFYVSPELIFSGGFKDAIPSLRVGVLF